MPAVRTRPVRHFSAFAKGVYNMIKTFERETVLTYSVMPPLYVPFRNAWVKENGR